jgi:glycosyltransferase involved in cell wall biosynthesis
MPIASVVIPWHRNLDDLRRAIASVFAQSEQDFEIIVVVNGVGDDDFRSVVDLSDDARFHVARLADAGASPARNLGLEMAAGELVFFLDADDAFLAHKIEHCIAAHRATGFDLAFSRGVRQRGEGVSWTFPVDQWDGAKHVSEFFFCDGCMISSSALVMASAVRDRLKFDPSCHFCQDPDLVIRAIGMGLRVEMLPEVLFEWSDEVVDGRISQSRNFADRLAWIDRLGSAVTPKAAAGFRARCVAQHSFPADFFRNLGFFANALRLGGARPHEVGLFMMRGLLPPLMRRRLLNLYFLALAWAASMLETTHL